MIMAAALHRVQTQKLDLDRRSRALQKGQTPRVVWFTGLSGAGKSTVANGVEAALYARGRHTYLLDGDNLRQGLNRDLGFGDEDRVENVRRAGEVARLMIDAGLIVLVALISPFRTERRMVRDLFAPGEFIEVYMSTPLETCERRDQKDLYRRARQGLIPNFTGISAGYEPPESPELALDASRLSVPQCVDAVLGMLDSRQT